MTLICDTAIAAIKCLSEHHDPVKARKLVFAKIRPKLVTDEGNLDPDVLAANPDLRSIFDSDVFGVTLEKMNADYTANSTAAIPPPRGTGRRFNYVGMRTGTSRRNPDDPSP